MIETFLIEKYIKSIISETEEENESFSNMKPKINITTIIVALIISSSAAFLAFNCNHYENPPARLLYTIFAFLFPGLYLIYFFIRYVMLGQKCGNKSFNKLIPGKNRK